MLNKKAIAAFAAGATLLSGLAFAAPAFVSAPAFAQNEATAKRHAKDIQKDLDKVNADLAPLNAALDAAKEKANKSAAAATAAYTKAVSDHLKDDGTLKNDNDATYEKDGATGHFKVKAGQTGDAAPLNTYVDLHKVADTDANGVVNAQNAVNPFLTKKNALEQELNSSPEHVSAEAKAKADKLKGELTDLKSKVDAAFTPYGKAHAVTDKADEELKAAKKDQKVFEAKASEEEQATKAYKAELKKLKRAVNKAQAAADSAALKEKELKAVFDAAEAAYNKKLGEYAEEFGKLVGDDKNGFDDPTDLALNDAVNYDVTLFEDAGDAGQGGKGDKGQGGQGEGGQGESGKGDKGHGDKPGKPGALPNAAQASANLMHAQVVLQDAAATKTKAVKDSNDAKANLDKAKAQFASLKAQFEAASDNYQNNFVLTGKADTDAGKAAKADVDAAKALVDAYGANELANAQKDYAEKSSKALVASQAFNKAKEDYRLAYNLALRVEASAVKGFQDPKTIADAPLDFPAATAAAKAEAGKLAAAAAQAGKAADAAAAGAHGAKAAAGENGGKKKNNAGEDAKKKLGQTGATVALAAVAASVLAGVGAALRKIRH